MSLHLLAISEYRLLYFQQLLAVFGKAEKEKGHSPERTWEAIAGLGR